LFWGTFAHNLLDLPIPSALCCLHKKGKATYESGAGRLCGPPRCNFSGVDGNQGTGRRFRREELKSMEPIALTIANELAAVPVVQTAAAAYCRAGGVEEESIVHTELVIEEVLAAILEHEYLPGQRAQISLNLSLSYDVLTLLVRFQGIPLDVEQLLRWEKASPLEIIAEKDNGRNLRLINWFSDEIEYRNRGWQGQEISIKRRISKEAGKGADAVRGGNRGEETPRETPRAEEIHRDKEPVIAAPPLRIGVRRMHPDEAAAVSRLAYFAYGYTYFNEYLYQPEEVRRRNDDGRLISYVAFNEEDGAVLGHLAGIPDDLSGMTELGAGFVNPRYRQSGAFQRLAGAISADLQKQGASGTFGTAVTSHPYSQRTVIPLGWKETALFVSRLPAMSFQAITDRETPRESLMYMLRMFDHSPRRLYYAPDRHRAMIAAIAANAGLTVSFAAVPPSAALTESGAGDLGYPSMMGAIYKSGASSTMANPGALSDKGEMSEIEEKIDANRTAHLVVRRWGADGIAGLRAALRRHCLDRLETLYLYLPLCHPTTAHFCPRCEDLGFFFAGLKPGRTGADWLVLQYLNNQRYDYGSLRAATPFGRELIDYVRNCDPVVTGY